MANDGDTITLTENVTMDINLVKLVNLDLNQKTVNGDVKITSSQSGTLTISAGTITGNLTVNVPSATVNNSATVEGIINIKDVSDNTWNELVSGNKLVFEAEGKTLNIVKGVLGLTIKANATIITSSPVEAKVENDVIVTVKASTDATEKIVIKGTDEVVKLDPKKDQENPKPSEVDKTELKAAIKAVKYVGVSTDGKDLDPEEKWTTQEAKTALEDAVKTAQKVVDNTEATEEVVAEAIDNLNKALEVYENAKQVGTKIDDIVVDKTGLEEAIQEAKSMKVKVSDDGSNVELLEKWTTQADLTTFEKAIGEAQGVVNNTEATEEEVTKAVKDLEKAVEAYKEAQKFGTKADEVVDKEALETAKVEAAKYEVEKYTEESYNALEDALKLPENTQEEVNIKVEAIKKAIDELVEKEDDSNKPIVVNSKEEYEEALKDALENFEIEVVIDVENYDESVYNLDSLNKIMLINPEIDYGYKGAKAEVKGVQGGNEQTITLNLEYHQSKEEMVEQKDATEAKVSKIIKNIINPGMSDVEKEIAIHDYIVRNAEYNEEGLKRHIPTDYNAYGVLVLGTGVCESYAKAFYILGQAAGLEVKYVTGKGINSSGDQENHAWNMIKLDGEWYNVDTTWDDPVVEDPEDKWLEVSYKYFNVPDSIMDETHIRDEELVKYPEAKGTKYTYENLDIEETDKDGNKFINIKDEDDLDIEIKDAIENKQDTLFLKLYDLGMNEKGLSDRVQEVINDNPEMEKNEIKSWELRLTGDSIKFVKYTFIYK